ncbi:MAG: baseplate J/gp47 family protein [Candidatus Accumulibacter sp. UW20]|jgi:hypothetical protein
MNRDLTRWNRAGLARVRYVDGNAAVFLERMRARLAIDFPQWPASVAEDAAPKPAMEALYARNPDDLLWQLTRAFARSSHVFAESLDAIANEGWIGTATQWESLRRLTAMLDYAPHPPASAFTELAVDYKAGAAGRLAAGFQVRHTSATGGKPVIFETLSDLDGDAALNELRPRDWERNPLRLSGATFILAGRFDKLRTGEPLLLEDERDGRLQAHQVVGASIDGQTTTLHLSPPVSRHDGLLRGFTRFHLLPGDKLRLREPRTTGAEIGRSLRLAGSPEGLRAGDLVAIGRPESKPLYRRIKAIHGEQLLFQDPLGEVDLANSTLMTPITVPIAHLGGNRRSIPPTRVNPPHAGWSVRTLYVAGDWSWLAGRWLADIRHAGNPPREYLPLYECFNADYFPPAGDSQRAQLFAGYTAITLTWSPAEDRTRSGQPLDLDNPQALLVAPRIPGPWRPDTFLQKSNGGHLSEPLLVEQPRKLAPGDLAVVARGACLAWARLRHVSVDGENSVARLETLAGWQDRGDGPFYLESSRVFGHFGEVARLSDATTNDTPIADPTIPLATLPAALRPGRSVLADNGSRVVSTRVSELSPPGQSPWLRLADPPPKGSRYGNLRLLGNVVAASHGEAKPRRVLGSGNGALNHQRFLIDVVDLSFVADPGMPSGVRADLAVSVAGETWTQRANLADSGAADAHYQVRQSEDGSLWIEFGDGRHGRRLPTGGNNILVNYRQGVGAAGNLPPGSLFKAVHPNPLIAGVRQPMAAAGGSDREAVAALRDNAASALLALERAVSLGDFAALARANAGVAQAIALRLPTGRGQREKVEVVVVPAGGSSFTTALKGSLEAFLLAHSLPGVQPLVSAYQPLTLRLKANVRSRPEAFEAEAVKAAVIVALAAAFALERRKLGQVLYRGEVYGVVEAVTGVENSDVELLIDPATAAAAQRVARDGSGRVLSVHPTARQCVHLASAAAIEVHVEDFSL